MPDAGNILLEKLNFPEGPAFDPGGGLWCVEMEGGGLVRVQANGQARRYPSGGKPNGLAFDHAGRAWVCDSGLGALLRFDPTAETWARIVDTLDGEPLYRPNDLAFDARGNLVFTCPGAWAEALSGYVACLRRDGSVVRVAEGLSFPNGLAFLDGGRTLVVGETRARRLLKGAWDADSARWIDPQPWAATGDGVGPDGMAAGVDGRLYVAVYGSRQVKVFRVDGAPAEAYDLPGANPTNAAFDPSGRLGLVVTEAERGLLLSLPGVGPGAPLFDGGMG